MNRCAARGRTLSRCQIALTVRAAAAPADGPICNSRMRVNTARHRRQKAHARARRDRRFDRRQLQSRPDNRPWAFRSRGIDSTGVAIHAIRQ